MAQVLIVYHSQSGTTTQMADAVIRGARSPGIANVDVRIRTALDAMAEDLLWSDGFVWSDALLWADGFVWSDLHTEALFTESWIPQE